MLGSGGKVVIMLVVYYKDQVHIPLLGMEVEDLEWVSVTTSLKDGIFQTEVILYKDI